MSTLARPRRDPRRRRRPAAATVLVLLVTALRSFDPQPAVAGVKKFRREQPRPIELGTSGGNATAARAGDDVGTLVCSSGTLGALVHKNGSPYILSNNHVIALENEARRGDPIDQPGLVDNDCLNDPDNYVGRLHRWKKLKWGGEAVNKVDAAIAEVIPGTVDPQGSILRVGIPGGLAVEPELGLAVKKSGRTTGLTRGRIIAVDVTVLVGFSANANARFERQIVVASTDPARSFVQGGDSGALVVLNRRECPAWVGLLFAGTDDGVAVVTPITTVFEVLGRLKPKGAVTPVGCAMEPAPTAAAALRSPAAARAGRPLRAARRARARHQRELLAHAGVVGIGVGTQSPDSPALELQVFVTDRPTAATIDIPPEIDGIPTRVVVTGHFRAR